MKNSRDMYVDSCMLPGERVLDRLKIKSYSNSGELALTNQRVVFAGHTSALGPHLTLLQGNTVSGFSLKEFDSFILGAGRRPSLFLLSLCFFAAGALMLFFPFARYPGIVFISLSIVSFLAWLAWPRTFMTVSSKSLRISGRVNICEASIFVERLQLAARSSQADGTKEDIEEAILASGRNGCECEEVFDQEEEPPSE
jgi:hypothetical protein